MVLFFHSWSQTLTPPPPPHNKTHSFSRSANFVGYPGMIMMTKKIFCRKTKLHLSSPHFCWPFGPGPAPPCPKKRAELELAALFFRHLLWHTFNYSNCQVVELTRWNWQHPSTCVMKMFLSYMQAKDRQIAKNLSIFCSMSRCLSVHVHAHGQILCFSESFCIFLCEASHGSVKRICGTSGSQSCGV